MQEEKHLVDLSKYTNSTEFKLVSMKSQRNVQYYACCKEPFIDITYTVIVKRRSLFYVVNLILPLVMLSLLTALAFIVPPETGK